MVKYVLQGTAPAETFYRGLSEDPISAITSTLVYNVRTENIEQARIDYVRLVKTINTQGRARKDIKYAARELCELARTAEAYDKKEIAALARRYASQLPLPIGVRRQNGHHGKVNGHSSASKGSAPEVYMSDVAETNGAGEDSIMNLLQGYDEGVISAGLRVARDYAIVREQTLDHRFLFEAISSFGEADTHDLVVLAAFDPKQLVMNFKEHKVDGKLVLIPKNSGVTIDDLTSRAVLEILAGKGVHPLFFGERTQVYDFLGK